MDLKCFESEYFDSEEEETNRKNWTYEDVYYYLYKWCGCYDEPWNALAYGSITSPRYRGGDFWKQWKQDHWVGSENIKERALADPFVRKHLKKYGLLPDEKDEGKP